MQKPRVVADVDTGIDDSLALIYLAGLHSTGQIDLVVTTSAGNTTARQAAVNSAEVLRLAGAADVPVVAGARSPLRVPLTTTPETHGEKGLGYYSPLDGGGAAGAVGEAGSEDDARAAVESWRGATHILIAGPATNLAWALRHAPEAVGGATGSGTAGAEITLMTGAFNYPGNTTPTAEWNAWVDPHALKEVFAAPASTPASADAPASTRQRPTICPLNVTEQVLLYPERLRRWQQALRPTRPELATLLGDALRFYFEFHQSVGVGYCAQIHDLAAAMVMLRRVPCSFYDATVDVEADSPLMRGTTVADRVAEVSASEGAATSGGAEARGAYWDRPANARILESLDPADVFAEFERVVCG
ncbi:nucleoside hydrolase [Corynebacterium evansiae]|uniref:Nucleoside hydrolase n=1 Tax=Corynebacterium evansiae TaxID=2913499 RepID=A0A9X3RHJ9_9CORY|nr:nucleoside hydrolase [Corynebacterium evansiae]MCZ9289938.1 nucleoside hydrolase [Corynebacterium evansiae]